MSIGYDRGYGYSIPSVLLCSYCRNVYIQTLVLGSTSVVCAILKHVKQNKGGVGKHALMQEHLGLLKLFQIRLNSTTYCIKLAKALFSTN